MRFHCSLRSHIKNNGKVIQFNSITIRLSQMFLSNKIKLKQTVSWIINQWLALGSSIHHRWNQTRMGRMRYPSLLTLRINFTCLRLSKIIRIGHPQRKVQGEISQILERLRSNKPFKNKWIENQKERAKYLGTLRPAQVQPPISFNTAKKKT